MEKERVGLRGGGAFSNTALFPETHTHAHMHTQLASSVHHHTPGAQTTSGLLTFPKKEIHHDFHFFVFHTLFRSSFKRSDQAVGSLCVGIPYTPLYDRGKQIRLFLGDIPQRLFPPRSCLICYLSGFKYSSMTPGAPLCTGSKHTERRPC